MSDLSVEALRALLSEEQRRLIRIRQARHHAPKATLETLVALVAFDRGISDRQLEQFYVSRKGAKKRRFDHHAFAKKYDISLDWLWEGDLRGHPRGMTKQPRKNSCQSIQPQGGDAA
jgi:hypothetical protein